MAGDTNDPRRSRPIDIKWLKGGLIGQLSINGHLWGAIEWSGKRNAWCIEDACGRCLAHEPSICGQAAARDAAMRLARAMVRDGRMPSPEEARRLHGDQVATRPTTIPAIMTTATFALGVSDVRAGRPFHHDADLWRPNDAWAYERGRLWAVLTPKHVPLKINGKINPDAVAWYARCGDDIL